MGSQLRACQTFRPQDGRTNVSINRKIPPMQTIEIDKDVFESMVKSMRFLHTMVSRIWRQLHTHGEADKWLTPYTAANIS